MNKHFWFGVAGGTEKALKSFGVNFEKSPKSLTRGRGYRGASLLALRSREGTLCHLPTSKFPCAPGTNRAWHPHPYVGKLGWGFRTTLQKPCRVTNGHNHPSRRLELHSRAGAQKLRKERPLCTMAEEGHFCVKGNTHFLLPLGNVVPTHKRLI